MLRVWSWLRRWWHDRDPLRCQESAYAFRTFMQLAAEDRKARRDAE